MIHPNEPWNGPGVTIGPRVYVPNGNQNGYSGAVECFDYSTSTGCASFPKTFSGLYYLYTVNADPARPTCLWANADSGSGQIQSFDAYTGGACGSGAIRLLASQFVVPQAQCTPSTYRSLQIISPARNTYTSGSIEFDNGAGNPLGIPNGTLDATGSVDLSGLSLNTATGLPQFLVTLVGAPADTGNVVVQLTWESSFDPACIAPGTVVTKEATTITTSLSGDGKTGASIVVAPGAAVTDSATLAGVNASGATGTVTYTWYANNTCTTVASAGAAQAITTPGTLPSSAPVTLAAGTYYAIASYSGDAGNLATAGLCGAEVLKVQSPVNANSIKREALAGLNALAAGDVCKKSKGKDDKKGKDGKKGDDDDDEDCGKRFASPIKKVTKSLTAAWWLDDNHLTLNGCGVFDNEKAAASQLRELLRSKKLSAAQKAAIQAVIDQLVQADQILAQTAVDEATAGNGNAKKLALANKALAKAAALIAAGKPDEAINQYRIAWEKAQESLGRKVCGDDGHEDEDGHEGGHHDRSDD